MARKKSSSNNIYLHKMYWTNNHKKSNDNPMAQTAVAAVETTHSQSNSEFDQVKRLNTQYKYRRTRNNFDSFEFTCFNFHHWLHLVCSIYLVALWYCISVETNAHTHSHARTHTWHFSFSLSNRRTESERSVYLNIRNKLTSFYLGLNIWLDMPWKRIEHTAIERSTDKHPYHTQMHAHRDNECPPT